MSKSGSILSIVLAIVVVILLLRECGNDCIKLEQGEVIVTQAFLDSIGAIANRPPEIHYDTIYRDTGSYHVVYKDPPAPVQDTDSTYSIPDSLSTAWFDVRHTLWFRVSDTNSVKSPILNRWSYKYKGAAVIVKTVTQYVAKPVPYKVAVPASGFFYGGFTSASKYTFAIGPQGSYLKNDWSYDVGAGYQYVFGQKEGGLLISAGVKKKF